MPDAKNVVDLLDAPVVAINGSLILVDGALAGSERAIVDSGRVQKIDELFSLLKAKRDLARVLRPDQPPPSACILQVDRDAPALVVKAAFYTAALAGFPNVSFLVRRVAALP